ncbi:MAG: beta-propeller domain-containing protein [Labilithrix sp.]|nr:beta-propeller domain-containing protein [Labilithrix sp.]
MRLRPLLLLTASFSVLALAAGCGSGGGDDFAGEVDNGFESDDPSGQSASRNAASSSSGSSGGSGGADAGAAAPESADDGAGGGAERVVQEADIIKVDGNRLYALSKFGGLAIVDITNPDAMKLLGRKRIDGMPFEMYVEGGRAFIMLNEFGRWVHDEASLYGQWVQTSEILAFDISNPAAISEVAHFDVPGTIADSRLVGDAAYVVTYENGYCWGCQESPATIVTSFKVGSTITKSDQLVYSAPNKSYSSWQRSVSATNQRLYIAGPEWTWTPGSSNASSVIQVVDISNPSGKLTKGADVPVAGQINSRWQMDEHAGVLRVVSQFGNGWGSAGQINPKVQTFTVTSASQVTPLGSTELILPKPEQLRSVRFDGLRGYAITAERTDPLFTIDLSNPAAPAQAGELHMPGWIFHMEPRGDRLVGFGYDETNASARLAVSLFDVSDLASPTMLKRVSFGTTGGHVAEDQDRIHKSVRILDDQGMILVPFASYGWWNNEKCEAAQSGIQILDYGRDTLALRGVAPQWGMPRRAFVANGRLLAMSDRNVSSFDITSRDAPVKTSELDLSNPAYRLAELTDHVASITSDWWSGEAMLSLTPKANADDAAVSGKLSLASLAPPSEVYCGGKNGWAAWYEARLFANGDTVYVTVPVYSYDYKTNVRGGKLIAAAVDVSTPNKPVLVGKTEALFTERDMSKGGYWGWYGGGFWDGWAFWSYYRGQQGSLVGSGQAVVQHGAKLAYIETDHEPIEIKGDDGFTKRWDFRVHRRIHVLDFTAPAAPKTDAVELPDSFGSSPLHLYKGAVLTSRWVQSTKNPDKVRFFVDRVDLNGPKPSLLSSINVPGSLLLVDEPSSRWVTTDYRATRIPANDYSDCFPQVGSMRWFDYEGKQCISVARDFKLTDVAGTKVTLRQTMTPPSQNIAGVQIADDRIYVTRYRQYDYSQPATSSGSYTQPKILEDGGLWAIGGIRAGQLSIVSEMAGDADWPLAAHGTKVALYTSSGLAIYDTATPKPTLVNETKLRGWGYSSHVLMSDTRAIASLGEWGLQTIAY